MPEHVAAIGILGAGRCDEATRALAFEVGERLGREGCLVVCGGLGGVMEGAAEGARRAGATTVGILPGDASSSPPNPSIEVPVFTGMGQARNQLIVLSSDALIAISGGWGTLNEIALAQKYGKPIVLLESWDPQPRDEIQAELTRVDTPTAAVRAALTYAGVPAHDTSS